MKCLVCITCLMLLGWGSCGTEESGSEETTTDGSSKDIDVEDALRSIKLFINKKCEEVGGEEAVVNFEEAVSSLMECLEEYVPECPQDLKNSIHGMCHEKTEIHDCFDGTIKALEGCSTLEEKFLPRFIFDAIEGLLIFLCSEDFNLEDLSDPGEETLACIEILKKQDNLENICYDIIHPKLEDPDNSLITHHQLCNDLDLINHCVEDYLEKACPTDKVIKKIAVGVMGAIASTCYLSDEDTSETDT